MHAVNDMGKSFTHHRFSVDGPYNDQWSHHYAQASNAANAITFEQYVLGGPLGPLMRSWYSSIRFREADFPVSWFKSREPFRWNLHRIARYARVDASKMMFVTQPFLYKSSMSTEELNVLYRRREYAERSGRFSEEYASIASLASAMAAFNSTTREVALLEDVHLVDAARQIHKNLSNFADEVH